MEQITIGIGGMSCQGCVNSVTRVLQALDGVSSVEVTLEPAQARVTFDPVRASVPALRAAIEDAGYEPRS